jgi:hypothetical protein
MRVTYTEEAVAPFVANVFENAPNQNLCLMAMQRSEEKLRVTRSVPVPLVGSTPVTLGVPRLEERPRLELDEDLFSLVYTKNTVVYDSLEMDYLKRLCRTLRIGDVRLLGLSRFPEALSLRRPSEFVISHPRIKVDVFAMGEYMSQLGRYVRFYDFCGNVVR